MTRHGQGEHFWGLILPHGMLELTAVFVAGGVGLRLFWSWVEPGQLTRSQSLAREGRTAGTVALGLVAVLLVSGLIEAFVTPSGLPTVARVGIGVVAEACFLAYVFVLGRNAVHRGHTGDLDAALLEDRVATQARTRQRSAEGRASRATASATGVSRPVRGGRAPSGRGSGRRGRAADRSASASTTSTPSARSSSAVRRRRTSTCSAAAASYTSSSVPRVAASRSSAGSRTEARTTRWWRVSAGSTGSSPSSIAEGSSGVSSTTSARCRPSR